MGGYQTSPDLARVLSDAERRMAKLERAAVSGARRFDAPDETSTGSQTPIVLDGPSLSVNSRPGALIAFFLDAEVKRVGSSSAHVYYDIGEGPVQFGATFSNSYVRLRSNLIVVPLDVSSITVTMKYAVASGGDTGFYRNRRIWARAL